MISLKDEEIEGIMRDSLMIRHIADIPKGRQVAKAQLKKAFEKLEEQVFYVDNRGFITLKPNATKNWQVLVKEAYDASNL